LRLVPVGDCETGEGGEMIARVPKIRPRPFADRIGHLREHDGYSVTLLPQHRHDWRAVGQDQVRRHAYQLGRVGTQYFGISCPAVFDSEVVSFDPPQLPQSIFEVCCTRQSFRIVDGEPHQYTDAPHLAALLRALRQWPKGYGAAKRDN